MSGKEINKDNSKISQSLIPSFIRDFFMNYLVEFAPIILSRRYLRNSNSKRIPAKKWEWHKALTVVLLILACISGLATYGALTEAPPFGDSPNTVIWLLNIDLVILLFYAWNDMRDNYNMPGIMY